MPCHGARCLMLPAKLAQLPQRRKATHPLPDSTCNCSAMATCQLAAPQTSPCKATTLPTQLAGTFSAAQLARREQALMQLVQRCTASAPICCRRFATHTYICWLLRKHCHATHHTCAAVSTFGGLGRLTLSVADSCFGSSWSLSAARFSARAASARFSRRRAAADCLIGLSGVTDLGS